MRALELNLLRKLDGLEIQSDDKVKAENLHGTDVKDREKIFKAQLPEEKFVDRRLFTYEDIEPESEDSIDEEGRPNAMDAVRSQT